VITGDSITENESYEYVNECNCRFSGSVKGVAVTPSADPLNLHLLLIMEGDLNSNSTCK